MWSTPQAKERGGRQSPGSHLALTKQVAGWNKDGTRWLPTPVSSMHKGSSPKALTRANGKSRERDRLDHAVSAQSGEFGPLNPEWVEWLMGFPMGWTDLKPSETP